MAPAALVPAEGASEWPAHSIGGQIGMQSIPICERYEFGRHSALTVECLALAAARIGSLQLRASIHAGRLVAL